MRLRNYDKKRKARRAQDRAFVRKIVKALDGNVEGFRFALVELHGDVGALAIGAKRSYALRVSDSDDEMRFEIPGLEFKASV